MKLFAEVRKRFPDPKQPTLDGIVAIGDELNVDTLFEAYSFGIFPWPHAEMPCLWFCPDQRGVLDFTDLHVSQSLKKVFKQKQFTFTFNQNFSRVMQECALVPRPGQSGTWITPQIEKAYNEFHKLGYAHSIECWQGDQLVGGLYGVYVAGIFCGESMFFKVSNASKACLVRLVDELKLNGLSWIDIQMVTGVTEKMGGKYISKLEYLERLKQSKKSARPLLLR